MLIITYAQEGTYRQRLALINEVNDGATVSIMMPGNKQILKKFDSVDACIVYSDKLLLNDFPVKGTSEYDG